MSAFSRMATLTVSLKRSTINATTHKAGVPTQVATGIKCTPFDPAEADLLLLAGITAAGVYLQTTIEGQVDLVHGDVLNVTSVDKGLAPPYTIVGKDYPVRGIQASQWRNTVTQLVIVEYLSQPTP